MEAALVGACEVPLEIMRTCAEAIDLIETFAEKGSKIAISDAGVGATLLKSALQGASLNIYINTKSMADKEAAASYNKEADELREKYDRRLTRFSIGSAQNQINMDCTFLKQSMCKNKTEIQTCKNGGTNG